MMIHATPLLASIPITFFHSFNDPASVSHKVYPWGDGFKTCSQISTLGHLMNKLSFAKLIVSVIDIQCR
jgi:hypothetical protein